jgi:cyclic pyranopterin phosphate synthase
VSNFTHIDDQGFVRMVDVTGKPPTDRQATAQAVVTMQEETFLLIRDRGIKKGNVLETARIAGTMAAKRTADLIPMCHPIQITHIQIDFFPNDSQDGFRIEAVVRCIEPTGVEMEALTAAAVAGLTIYDMCKSYDRNITISDILLLKKSGGKSGVYISEDSSGK